MKRQAATAILLMAYLLTSLQVVLQVHSCPVQGVEVQWYAVDQKECCAEDPADDLCQANHCSLQKWDADCCETAQITFRLDQPQELTRPLLIPAVAMIPAVVLLALVEAEPEPTPNRAWEIDPPPPKVSLWRRHCAALTYG
jgi:hypothetical protein